MVLNPQVNDGVRSVSARSVQIVSQGLRRGIPGQREKRMVNSGGGDGPGCHLIADRSAEGGHFVITLHKTISDE